MRRNDKFFWIFFISMLLFLTVMVIVANADCTPEQLSRVGIITGRLNLTLNETLELVSLFNSLCNQTSNITMIYNDSLLVSNITNISCSIANITGNMSSLAAAYASLNSSMAGYSNYTNKTFFPYDRVEGLKGAIISDLDTVMKQQSARVDQKAIDMENQFDSKVKELKAGFITLENFTSEINTIRSDMNNLAYRPTPADIYSTYVFWIAIVIIIAYMAASKFGVMSKLKLPKAKYKVSTAEDETSDSDIKRRADKLRDQRLKVLKSDLTKEHKASFLKDITDQPTLVNDNEFEKQFEYYNLLEMPEKVKKIKPKR